MRSNHERSKCLITVEDVNHVENIGDESICNGDDLVNLLVMRRGAVERFMHVWYYGTRT